MSKALFCVAQRFVILNTLYSDKETNVEQQGGKVWREYKVPRGVIRIALLLVIGVDTYSVRCYKTRDMPSGGKSLTALRQDSRE